MRMDMSRGEDEAGIGGGMRSIRTFLNVSVFNVLFRYRIMSILSFIFEEHL